MTTVRVPFEQAVLDVTGGNPRLLTTEYKPAGAIPVIDQGQAEIAGFTDDLSAACRRDGPVVLFGDHTRTFKFVDFDFALGADGVKVLKPLPGFDARFLFHFLRTVRLPENLGYSRHFKYLKECSVPKPEPEVQRRIAAILDKADDLRRKRQKAIRLADEFLKAVFIDMFGDPVTNPKGWPTKALGKVCSKIGSGATPKGGDAAYKDEGIALIRSMNVRDGNFLWKDLARIDDEQAMRLSNVVVEEDDVLINITGASVARVCRAPREVVPARVNQHVSILRPIAGLEAPFLEQLLLASSVKQQLLRIGEAGATRQAITKAELEAFEIIVPPEHLQARFSRVQMQVAAFVKKASKSAVAGAKLSASLQSQFFGGQ